MLVRIHLAEADTLTVEAALTLSRRKQSEATSPVANGSHAVCRVAADVHPAPAAGQT